MTLVRRSSPSSRTCCSTSTKCRDCREKGGTRGECMNPRTHTEGCDAQFMWNGVYIDETAQRSHDAQNPVIDRSTHAQRALGRIVSVQQVDDSLAMKPGPDPGGMRSLSGKGIPFELVGCLFRVRAACLVSQPHPMLPSAATQRAIPRVPQGSMPPPRRR